MYLNNLEKYFILDNNKIIDFQQTIPSYNEFLNPLQFAIKYDFLLNDKQWEYLILNTNLNNRDIFNNSIFHLLLIFDKLIELNDNTIKFLVYNTDYKIKNHLNKNVLNLIFVFKDKHFLNLFSTDYLLFIINQSNLYEKTEFFENLSSEIINKFYDYPISLDIWDKIIYDMSILDKAITYYNNNYKLNNLKNNLLLYRHKKFLEKELKECLEENHNLNKI